MDCGGRPGGRARHCTLGASEIATTGRPPVGAAGRRFGRGCFAARWKHREQCRHSAEAKISVATTAAALEAPETAPVAELGIGPPPPVVLVNVSTSVKTSDSVRNQAVQAAPSVGQRGQIRQILLLVVSEAGDVADRDRIDEAPYLGVQGAEDLQQRPCRARPVLWLWNECRKRSQQRQLVVYSVAGKTKWKFRSASFLERAQ